MATANSPAVSSPELNARYCGLDRETMQRAFRLMHTARRLDDREVMLKRQNRIDFQISGAGHEAIQCAAGPPSARPRLVPSLLSRSRACPHTRRHPGNDAPPERWRRRRSRLRRPPDALPLELARASHLHRIVAHRHPVRSLHRLRRGRPPPQPRLRRAHACHHRRGRDQRRRVLDPLNAACLNRLPVIYLVEDNGYAISTPVERQTPGGSISGLLTGFPGLLILECDGNDFLYSYRAVTQAAEYVRSRQGPAFVHAHCTRPYSHSLSDDERLYKTQAERDAESERDPIIVFPRFLIREGLLEEQTYKRICHEVDVELAEITDRVLKAAPPAKSTATDFLYSPGHPARPNSTSSPTSQASRER